MRDGWQADDVFARLPLAVLVHPGMKRTFLAALDIGVAGPADPRAELSVSLWGAAGPEAVAVWDG